MSKIKRAISMSVLPGQPTDGSGRVCVHLFVRDPSGPITEPNVLYLADEPDEHGNRLRARPERGRLACDRNRRVTQVVRNGATVVTMRTDDYRAVTCPRCIASADYAAADDLLKSLTGENT